MIGVPNATITICGIGTSNTGVHLSAVAAFSKAAATALPVAPQWQGDE